MKTPTPIAGWRHVMRRTIRIMTTVSLPLVALMCVSLHAETLTARLNTLLDAWKQKDAPGMASVLIRDGRIEYRKTFGLADLDARTPITSNTQFLLASVTEQFTAMAIMVLAEGHKLQFDDTLAKSCPEFPDYARTVTIRHLLNHTAGFTQYQELLVGKVDENYFRSSKSPPHEFTAAEVLQVLSRQEKLRFPPGDKFEYSDSAYVVLGQIIERITGKRYAAFLKETIFDPGGVRCPEKVRILGHQAVRHSEEE
jgi:CubicO group peptidase (beta-lactamase class C family)